MRIRGDGLVYIESQEITPVKCEWCGVIYQPDSEAAFGSRCRNCGNCNWHGDQFWLRVNIDADDDLYKHQTNQTNARSYDRPGEPPND